MIPSIKQRILLRWLRRVECHLPYSLFQYDVYLSTYIILTPRNLIYFATEDPHEFATVLTVDFHSSSHLMAITWIEGFVFHIRYCMLHESLRIHHNLSASCNETYIVD